MPFKPDESHCHCCRSVTVATLAAPAALATCAALAVFCNCVLLLLYLIQLARICTPVICSFFSAKPFSSPPCATTDLVESVCISTAPVSSKTDPGASSCECLNLIQIRHLYMRSAQVICLAACVKPFPFSTL